jgi:hypothetical protein
LANTSNPGLWFALAVMSTPHGRHLRVLGLERKTAAVNSEKDDIAERMAKLKARSMKLADEQAQLNM